MGFKTNSISCNICHYAGGGMGLGVEQKGGTLAKDSLIVYIKAARLMSAYCRGTFS